MRRRGALCLIVLSGGCCFAGAAAPTPAPTTTTAAPAFDPACIGLCERLAGCDRDEGRAPSAADCSAGCSAGGVYSALDATMFSCAGQPSCDAVRQCAAPGLAATLLGSFASASPTTAPADWPAGFPTVPGGVARAAPAMGPVRVALIAYPGRDVGTTLQAYRDALTAAGWALADVPAADGEAIRFTASRGSDSVSVSVYREGGDAIVQTMQLGTSFGVGAS